ncbi:MAG: hypothetical protein KC931_00230 [Candidatus Omnitrophica bacterium]|nr:hypothetical protein [Candidatus Omnitrophota bacterium]MCA9414886.1 hypothetical protein [Candidatus Omnitrophota bacterium]MCA9423420.1 hypothetical protein [Candidatus Omnitrophota bacterium]MCA9430033.1 hypothetical protein [Candidatus Omnitrophota bacterium]MCA9438636.1 hypothetical protein [Candidatus Omnitrophota bacterium]
MKRFAWTFIAGFLIIPTLAWSASVIKMDIDDLTKRSDLAVVGKVTSISHQNVADRYPETLYKMQVLQTIYGAADGEEITICLPGGPAGDGLTTFVPGMPRFKVDEKVAVFLVLDQDRNIAVPTGLEQGVFRIKIHPDTEEEYVTNQTVPIEIDAASDSGTKISGTKNLSLTKFRKVVKEKATKLKEKK